MSIFDVLKAVGKVVDTVAPSSSSSDLHSDRRRNMSKELDFRHLTDLTHSFGTRNETVGDAKAYHYSVDCDRIEDFAYFVVTRATSPNGTNMSTTDFLLYLRRKGYTKQTTCYSFSFGEQLEVKLEVTDESDKGHWCLSGDFSHIVDKVANSFLYTSNEINDILAHYHLQYGGVTPRMDNRGDTFSSD